MEIEYEALIRALWTRPAGRVRTGLVAAVDDLRRAQSLPPLTESQRVSIARAGDLSFATVNLSRAPTRTTMLTLWRGRSR